MTLAAVRALLARGWAWAISPLGRALCAVLAVLGLLWAVYALSHHAGVSAERRRWEAKVAADAKQIAELTAKANATTANLRGAHDARDDQIRTVTRTLIQKVPVYVTPEDDARCPVPAGAVSLLNAAVSGEPAVAPSPGGPDQAASAVPLSTIVATGVDNVGIGQQWRDEALTWRAWWTQQSKLWGKAP